MSEKDEYEQVKNLSKLCWELREEDNELSVACDQYALIIAEKIKNYHEIAQINNFLGVGALYHFEFGFQAAQMENDTIELALAS